MSARLRPYIESLAIAAVYVLAGKFGLSFSMDVPEVTVVWPPSGIALAALLICGIQRWPGIMLGAFLTNVTFPVSPGVALGIAAGNTLEAVCGAYVLRRMRFSNRLERVRDVVAVMLVAIPACAIAAAAGASLLWTSGHVPAPLDVGDVFQRWWIGDMAGICGVTPLLLTWSVRPYEPQQRKLEAALILVLVVSVTYCALLRQLPIRFLILPLLAWSGIRLNQRWTALNCFMLTAIAVWAASMGVLSFTPRYLEYEERLGLLMLFTGVTKVTALMLGAAVIERRRITDAYCLKSTQLELALEAGHVGVWEWDVRSGEIKWSENLITIHCMTPKNAPCNLAQYFATIYEADRAQVKNAIERALKKKMFKVEYRSARKDGSLAWYAAQGVLQTDAAGVPERMLGVCADVTERKLAEEHLQRSSVELERLVAARTSELHDSKERLRQLVEQVPAILFSFDRNLRQTTASGSGLRLLNLRPEDLVGRAIAEVLESDPVSVHIHDLKRALEGEARSFETEWRGRYLSIHVDPLRDAGGAIIGVVGLAVDITERKRAEALLAEEARRKDQFLAVLAHELRNPLAPIRNAVELLQRQGLSAPHTARACEIISRQLKHMVHLIDDLLDVARISHGKILLRKQRLDLAALLGSVVDEHRGEIAAHGLQIDAELPTQPVWIDGDPTRITQVFDNLLQNAVKFTPPGGRVAVTLAVLDAQREVRIAVRDTGIGMEPATLATLFEPFAQADQSLDRSSGGLGLGLALSRQLLELHGARIEAHSAGIGRGSEFRIFFPLMDVAPQPVAGELPSKAAPLGLKIEIIEDNPDTAESLRLLLETLGHTPRAVHDARAGLELARTFRPDVVLCDIGLPQGMNGYEFAVQFRKDPAQPPAYLIALTGYGQEQDIRRALAAGFNAHLTKPVSLEDLESALAREQRPTFSP